MGATIICFQRDKSVLYMMTNGTGKAKATFCFSPIFLKSTKLLVRTELVIWIDRLTIVTVTKKRTENEETA